MHGQPHIRLQNKLKQTQYKTHPNESHNINKYPQYKAMRPIGIQYSVVKKHSNKYLQHTKVLGGGNKDSWQKGVRLFSHI